MLYELVTLSSPPLAQNVTSDAAHDWVCKGGGKLLGVWHTEIGELFQIKLLRAFDSIAALDEKRMRMLFSAKPFGIDDPTVRLQVERYERFPFLPDVIPKDWEGFTSSGLIS